MSGKKVSAERLNELRKEAVRLRLEKKTLKEIGEITGLTRPTISSAYKRFVEGGWAAVATRPRGVAKSTHIDDLASRLLARPEALVPGHRLWSLAALEAWLKDQGVVVTGRSVARYAESWGFVPPEPPARETLEAQFARARGAQPAVFDQLKRPKLLSGGMVSLPAAAGTVPARGTSSPPGTPSTAGARCQGTMIYARDGRGQLLWLNVPGQAKAADIADFLARLTEDLDGPAVLLFNSPALEKHEVLRPWLTREHPLVLVPTGDASRPAYHHAPHKASDQTTHQASLKTPAATARASGITTSRNPMTLTHLQRLEAESIQIMREVVAETENPVMLYSIGKDSAVMLHLALKAFSPSIPPFPLLHVDTTWKFQEMYKFRERMAKETGMKLLVHVNEEGRAQGINPFTHGSAIHTDIMKTEALKQALDKYGFDAAFGGARRDEEKSRAKERIFSFRTAQHRWDPKNQRPEIWKLYNARKHQKESIRVFPLSNWTELDIWQYIHLEQIPIVPLYYAAERPVVERDGTLIMVDDERMPLNPGEVPMMKKVRFRTLGCYPLTGAVESDADTLPEIIQEMLLTKTSERQGRMIDHDSSASMEKKKQEGYF